MRNSWKAPCAKILSPHIKDEKIPLEHDLFKLMQWIDNWSLEKWKTLRPWKILADQPTFPPAEYVLNENFVISQTQNYGQYYHR